ncbi:alpha/beta fold hydrolase [Oerskovia rustica]|uniref:Alpha/beta hydrolase n=1 Tax=Oerskovia rustica TaxID=2762237 RepID=A0ABR8RMH4_9CELL|nr:alpha/beta hydrolase [Oerskovia rustica]MBD7948995.1 alpha/beta hydrolase [Oerskovia rustica]
MSTRQIVELLPRPEGRLAYTVTGTGPLVVAVPGMGDLRSTYRDLVPPLVEAGYRVAVLDLRGHGDSDTTFRTHGDVATGQDLLALVEHLGGPAVLVGNSMGAGAAAWAAAEAPDAVAGLVLLGPFLRDPATGAAKAAASRLLYRVALARPWGAAAWAGFYSMLTKGRRAPWHADHVAAIRASMRKPGRLRSFRDLALTLTHAPVEARLPEVDAPAIAFMGSLDPDFADQGAELAWIQEVVGAQGHLVPGVGHYPQHQAPDVVAPATLTFLAGLRADAQGWNARG